MCVRPYCPILLFYSLAIWSCCSGTSKWCWSWWCHLQLPITCTTTTHADPTRPMNGSDPCQTLETWIATSKWQCRTYTKSSLRRNTAVSLWYRHITTPLRVLAVHNNQSCWTLSRAPGPCVALYCSPYSLPQPPTSSVHHPGYRACVGPVRLLRDSLT